MLNALKKGDKIVTIGGIHGEITELGEEDIRLRIADKVEIKLTKGSVSPGEGRITKAYYLQSEESPSRTCSSGLFRYLALLNKEGRVFTC